MSQDISNTSVDGAHASSTTSAQFEQPRTFRWSWATDTRQHKEDNTLSSDRQARDVAWLPIATDPFNIADGEAKAALHISQGLCPVATGATDQCVPHLCGQNPPCQALWSLPDVEECSEVPCLTTRSDIDPCQSSVPPPPKKTRRESGDATPSTSSASALKSEYRRGSSDAIDEVKSILSRKANQKEAHSRVEKRYREHLNAKIFELYGLLSTSAQEATQLPRDQVKKAEVLQTAIDYVNQSQLEMRHMTDEIKMLKAKIESFELLIRSDEHSLLKGVGNMDLGVRIALTGTGASYSRAAPFAG